MPCGSKFFFLSIATSSNTSMASSSLRWIFAEKIINRSILSCLVSVLSVFLETIFSTGSIVFDPFRILFLKSRLKISSSLREPFWDALLDLPLRVDFYFLTFEAELLFVSDFSSLVEIFVSWRITWGCLFAMVVFCVDSASPGTLKRSDISASPSSRTEWLSAPILFWGILSNSDLAFVSSVYAV